MTETKKDELVNKLLDIYDSKDFVIGVLTNAKTEENWDLVLRFIDTEKDIDSDRVSLFALALGETV